MWKVKTEKEVTAFIEVLNSIKPISLSKQEGAGRSIPVWVQEFVFERDGGKCISCGSSEKLCFDHIIPFSKGGASDYPNNIQLLCSKCNGEKSANFWPVKVSG